MKTGLIGETAAKLMDGLGDGDGEVVAVAIVVAFDTEDGSWARTEFSVDRAYEQLGLLHAGLEAVTQGEAIEDDEE